MAIPNYYYGFLLITTCVASLTAQIGAADADIEAGSQLLGGKKLIIGLPKNAGFPQFVDFQLNSSDTKQVIKATGYAIEVFEAAVAYLKSLGYNISYEYRAFVDEDGNSAGDYNALVYQVYDGKYDAAVGDISVVANRSNYADFTLPFAPSDLKMLVKVRHDPRLNMWIFVQPFTWDLWLSIVIFSIAIGVIIQFMERKIGEDSTHESAPSRQQPNKFSILWLAVKQAVLPERESLVKSCSRFVLVIWLILVFVLMQSYTACLSSILTVNQLQPRYISENDVINNANINIGYHNGSFTKGLLIDHLGVNSSRVKCYNNIQDYKEALDKGSHKGGADAIFEQIAHINVFLNHYGSNYAMVDTLHRTDGFAYAFPKGSNLPAYFSRAILNVRESKEMDGIEKKYFGSKDGNGGQGLLTSSSDDESSSSLSTFSFGGLFIAMGILLLLALVVSESYVWRKPVTLAKTYSRQFLSHRSFKRTGPLEEGSPARRRHVDEEDFSARENNQNIGLEDGENNRGEIKKESLSCVNTEILPV